MEAVFLTLLRMSLSATWLVVAVLALRFLLRRAPKWTRCLLWALVALRLVCPFSVESPFSLVPKPVADGAVHETFGGVQVDLSIDDWRESSHGTVVRSVPPDGGESVPAAEDVPVMVTIRADKADGELSFGNRLARIWLAGMFAMLVYAIICYVNLRRRTAASFPVGEGVYICDGIDTPFILGVLRPRICLPSTLQEPQRTCVLAHERAHLARRDHWWKPLGYALLSVYWFNPALWLAYVLLCRDIELACDERVFRGMGLAERADYSQALLEQSRPGRAIAACPVAFGEVGVKERVKAALNYKKPAFWIVAVAVIACAVAAVCFLTDPKAKEEQPMAQELAAGYTLEQAKADGCLVMENGTVTAGKQAFQDFLSAGPGATLRIVSYYTLDDPSRYDPAYYEEVKGNYPALYVHELSYDGATYTYRGWEDGEEYVRQFPYLLRFAGNDRPRGGDPLYSIRYVLVGDPTVTWNKIVNGMLSSQSGDWIDHEVVYQERPDESPLSTLTLGDVRLLAQKGEALSARDFDGYEYYETGSGLYIKVYPIDDRFSVALGFGSPDESRLMYAMLSAKNGNGTLLGDSVDLRTGDVEAFIAAHSADNSGQEKRNTVFAGIMGFDGYYEDTVMGGYHHIRSYYANGRQIAESFGFENDRAHDYAVDLDGDGVTELICNCTYGGDCVRRVYVFRRSGDDVEWGTINYDKLALTAWDDWGEGSTAEWFDPDSGTFMVEYASLASSSGDGTTPGTFIREAGLDALSWEKYTALGGSGAEPTAQVQSPPIVYAAAPVAEPPAGPAEELPAEAAAVTQSGPADEPENSMVVVIDLSEYEEGEEP